MRLALTKVSKHYLRPEGPVKALDGVTLVVQPGEFVALQGPSGSGKTTLLLAAGALLRPDAGDVRLDGHDPYALSPDGRAALRARQIGFVFQQFYLVPYLNVLENVLAPALAAPDDGARARAEEMIERFGLGDRVGHVPAELSTGERQRVALARALLNAPGLLLADEPTGNLDQQNASGVLEALARFAAGGGAVLLVTHSAQVASAARRTVHIDRGRVSE